MKKKKSKHGATKEYDPFDIMDAVSGMDCTGLIQIPALSREDWETYNEIVQFAPPGTCKK